MPRKPKYTIQPVERSEVAGVDREILGKTRDDGVYPLSMAKEIRLDRIRPDPNQPRRTFDVEALDELASSISEQGVLQPIVVQFVDEGESGYFMLTHGERRWRAAQMAGLDTIPAIIREEASDAQRLVRQLMENIQREDLNAVDRAAALQALKEQLGNPSWETVAEKVGIKRSRLFQLLDVMKQPEAVQEDIRAGRLTEKHSRALQRVPEELRDDFRQAMLAQNLSGPEAMTVAREVLNSPPGWTIETAIRELRQPKPQQATAHQGLPPETPAVVDSPPPVDRPPERTVEGREAATGALAMPTALDISDPLAAIGQLEQALDELDPAAIADAATLRARLQAIIAKANALLERLGPEETPSTPLVS